MPPPPEKKVSIFEGVPGNAIEGHAANLIFLNGAVGKATYKIVRFQLASVINWAFMETPGVQVVKMRISLVSPDADDAIVYTWVVSSAAVGEIQAPQCTGVANQTGTDNWGLLIPKGFGLRYDDTLGAVTAFNYSFAGFQLPTGFKGA